MARTSLPRNSSNLTGLPQTNGTPEVAGYEHDEFYVAGYFNPKADVLPIVLAVLIIFINTVILFLMSRKKYLRSITNLLLCSLAVSDLLTGLVSVPLFITCNIVRQPAICIMEELMARFVSTSIVCHLMSVTMDRYLAIIHPLRYSSLVTRPRCILVILLIWLLSATTALVQLSWVDLYNHDPGEEPTDAVLKAELIYDVIFLTLYFLVPIGLMFFTYSRITLEIARQSRNIHQNYLPTNSHSRGRNRHERKAVAIFAAMLFTYIICWLPYFGLRRFDMSELPIPLIYGIFWIRYLASLLNPCMYILGKQDFRKAICDHQVKVELKFTSTSKSTVLRNTLAISGGKNEKIHMKSFSRIGSRKMWSRS